MRQSIYRVLVVVMLILGLGIFSTSAVFAAPGDPPDPCTTGDTKTQIKCGVTGSGGTGAKNQGSQVAVIIRTVVNILLFLIGAFAVIMIVIAGFRFVGANGDANTVSSARNTILYAVIGLVVAYLAYALVNFIVDQITKAPPATSSSSSRP
jgi:type IV secretion system pilin